MTLGEYFVQRWEAEQRAFRAVLAAVPGDKLDYRPHERSTSAGDLSRQLAVEQHDLAQLIDTQQTEYVPQPHGTIEDILAAWDKATGEMRDRLKSLDDAKLEKPAKFLAGGQVVWEESLGGMLWGFLFDMVHHRGQLSSYLRPMGAKVPAIYGPSADDQG
jgi:uncharacterized damage-inducible protein DinB